MANTQRNFIIGRMNKSLDERLVPNGEYVDALNVRLGSTEASEIGSVENSKGNTKLSSLQYEENTTSSGAELLSAEAKCIGVYEDGKNDRIYWFVHDPAFTRGLTGKLDLIVSFNPTTKNLAYHVVSIDDGSGANTTLNFNLINLITAVDKIGDLLFFTDNINPPRVINVLQNYPNPLFNADVITAEELMVIKKPPTSAPSLTLKTSSTQRDNYLETRFVCFAYRYQYVNGEYSATSQWSEPAFDPEQYRYDFASNLNEGMLNSITGVVVNYNSGSSLVVAVEILYKESTDTVIKIVEKINKSQDGLANNTIYPYPFSNSKIFTVLQATELLRQYDNVPRTAVAQTIMGNRLVYGNYIEGYDLRDLYSNPLKLEFNAKLVSGSATTTTLSPVVLPGDYTYGAALTIAGSIIKIPFGGLNREDFKAGSNLAITFTFEHAQWDPTLNQPTTITENIELQFSYNLPENFDSLFELIESQGFKEAIGTTTNILPVYAAPGVDTSCDGFTLTDNFNCFIPNTQTTPAGTVTKFASGIDGPGEPIKIVGNTPSSTSLNLQLPAMRYVTDPASPPGAEDFYEYYKIISTNSSFATIGVPRSLHSNRGYEIGIVYMDEFLRSSTALVSRDNTVQTSCANSRTVNQIQVTIGWAQRAPFWAKYYKFVIKPDQSTYETIFSEKYFKDPLSNSVFFLLEGENAAKIEAGQQLIVKKDSGGAVERCITTTVIGKVVQPEDFLTIPNPLDVATNIFVPSAPYMEIVPNGFNISNDGASIGGDRIANPAITITAAEYQRSQAYPIGRARVNVLNAARDAYVDYTIPVNSSITINIKQYMDGGTYYQRSEYTSPTLSSSADYTDFKQWFEGDNISQLIEAGTVTENYPADSVANTYNPALIDLNPAINVPPPVIARSDVSANPQDPQKAYIDVSTRVNYYQFYRSSTGNGGDNSLWFLATGTRSRSGDSVFGGGGASANVEIEIVVERANSGGVVVFESIPGDALPDVWYENEKSFDVTSIGEHQSNVQNQNIPTEQDAIVNTGFFNCFSFGNGVESYTIRDSIKGEAFALGNRVTTTSSQQYKEAHRFADLTYSGVFNDESNVNKLNEFNLGLANFKPLESSFASVQVLFARETDILVLQEDRISYVLVRKDLLSDAGGTGVLTSVPTVLGTQIARLEEYGISRNPESFAVFGENKFFTDEQRGAVIQLKGGAYNNESLTIISEAGMRSWFRDLFHDNFNSQKIGGFDPYMNEYVLSANTTKLPFVGLCDLCGTSRDISLTPGNQVIYCVNVTQEVGTVEVEYVFPSGGNNTIVTEAQEDLMLAETNSVAATGGTIVTEDSTSNNGYTVTVLYNGNTFTTGVVFVNGILSIPKDSVFAETLTIIVSSDSIVTDTIEVTTNCPKADQITIYQVAITTNADIDKFIHNEYRWIDGQFESPLKSELVQFISGTESPLVSQFAELTGPQGAGVIPDAAANVRIISNKIDFDDYDFLPNTNNFRYLRTSTFYGNIQADIISLLAAATKATPLVTVDAPRYYSSFSMPSGNTGDNLYLIWDYRNATEIQLCYSNVDLNDVCCNCAVDVEDPPVIPDTPQPCNQYTLATAGAATIYEMDGGASGGTYTCLNAQGNVNTGTVAPNSSGHGVCALTGTLVVAGTITFTTGIECATADGLPSDFTYYECSPGGVKNRQINVSLEFGAAPLVVCAFGPPTSWPRPSGAATGTVSAPGISCTEAFYGARLCGADETSFVQLSADSLLGRFNVGDTVECRLTSGALSCAEIIETALFGGTSGVILSQASGCDDTVKCPQSTQTYLWVTDAAENKGSSTNFACGSPPPGKMQNFLYTKVANDSSILLGQTIFYRNVELTLPFNGGSKFYALRYPVPPATEAVTGGSAFNGIGQINSAGQIEVFNPC